MTTVLEILMALVAGIAALAALIGGTGLAIALAVLLWRGWVWVWNHVSDPPRGGIEVWAKTIGKVVGITAIVVYFMGLVGYIGILMLEDTGLYDFSWYTEQE